MTDVTELFTELLFGSGAWFGLLLIVAVCLVVASQVKHSGIFFTLLLMFLGYEYLTQITNVDFLNVWFMFIAWGAAALTFYMFLGDQKHK